MKVFKQLNLAREAFHKLKLQKTGKNAFAGYSYFELSDFLVPALSVFKEHDLCAFVSFGVDIATMRIVCVEDGSSIEITSPMADANLKGCHPIQNLGAVETYTRRYLWVSALEIVEHDAVDASQPVSKAPRHTPTGEPLVSAARLGVVQAVAAAINERMQADDMIGAYEEYMGITDGEEKTALWKMLDSTTRRKLKEHGETLKG